MHIRMKKHLRGGSGNNDKEKEDKIIKNISKFVTLNKEELAK